MSFVLQKYSASWCSAFQKELKTVRVEMKKEIANFGNQVEKILKNGSTIEESLVIKGDDLMTKGDALVSSAKGNPKQSVLIILRLMVFHVCSYLTWGFAGFIESVRGFKKEFLSSLISALDSVFDVTKKTLDEFKRDNGRLDEFLKLEEKVKKLGREKEESEKQYR